MLSVSACWQKQYSEELFYLGGKVIFFFFPSHFTCQCLLGALCLDLYHRVKLLVLLFL